jgi:diaminopimelate epimerase
VQFSKGHGTENDFVVLPDPDGVLDLTPARVAALCDRRRGLGADGVLRVVRWVALGDGPAPEPGVEWFMDYRNADGSLAEMCGNGVRVFARYLEHAGWLPGGETRLGTRAGVRTVRVSGEEISVDMGPAIVGERSTASIDGDAFAGVAVDVGNPHLACVTDAAIEALDLTRPPGHDPALFPHGVNVEFVSPVDAQGEVVMRVHERGVGETRSCGTGTVAAVVAALRHAGRTDGTVVVHTPGGQLRVTVDERTTVLHGPAVLVAHGELTPQWWAAADREPAPLGA